MFSGSSIYLRFAGGFDEDRSRTWTDTRLAKVPKREKAEVLAAFAAHKDEVTAGYVAGGKRG